MKSGTEHAQEMWGFKPSSSIKKETTPYIYFGKKTLVLLWTNVLLSWWHTYLSSEFCLQYFPSSLVLSPRKQFFRANTAFIHPISVKKRKGNGGLGQHIFHFSENLNIFKGQGASVASATLAGTTVSRSRCGFITESDMVWPAYKFHPVVSNFQMNKNEFVRHCVFTGENRKFNCAKWRRTCHINNAIFTRTIVWAWSWICQYWQQKLITLW